MKSSPSVVALIPARSGSERVKMKNIRKLGGHPLIAYSIEIAKKSKIFDDIVVSTDSEEIRKISEFYGANCPFLRPKELASSVSIDVGWIKHALDNIGKSYDIFFIIRPTSPFRTIEMLGRAYSRFLSFGDTIDSLRAVNLCHEHPGKMWVINTNNSNFMKPFIEQEYINPPYHARQYQDLPQVFIQNSSLEIAWSYVIKEYNSREGKTISPFITEGYEGFSIDYEIDWLIAEYLISSQKVNLVNIDVNPL